MKCLIGKKARMTQVFDEEGKVQAATIIRVHPLTVTQIKTPEQDGYTAVQLSGGERNRVSKALIGHFAGTGSFAYTREFRVNEPDVALHDTIDVSAFELGDTVSVSGTTKGKGFQGVVKRHNFSGGPRSHGQKHSEREPGSIGGIGPQRVMKGKRMAGRMGNNRQTMKNLTVLAIDKERGELYVSGAIPGRPGSLVEVRQVS